MQSYANSQHMSLSITYPLMLNYCVWLLLYDGWRVAPFDGGHPEGNGLLRRGGLTPALWHMLARQALDIPAVFEWCGVPPLAERLMALWSEYAVGWSQRQWQLLPLHTRAPYRSPEFYLPLQEELAPLATRLPELRIYVAQYPRPVSYLLPPTAVLLSAADGLWDAPMLRVHIVQAAKDLVRGLG